MGKITWLASYPKSGNTWIRMLLSAYTKRKAVDINNIGFGFGDLHPAFYQHVLPPMIRVEHIDLPMAALIRPAALAGMVQQEDTLGGIYLKTHHANCQVDDIALIPPGLTERAVYVVRDPRQLALSYAKHFKCSVDHAIDSMNDHSRVIGSKGELAHVLGTWTQHVKSWLGSSFPVFCMRYEDIAPASFGNLLTFLGFEPDMQRILQAFEDCELQKAREQEKENGFHEAPEGVEFFEQTPPWYEELTQDQIDRIVDAHGETMEHLKYATGTLYYNTA